MPEEKLIVESKVKALLLKLPGVKSVGQEVLDMLSEGIRVAATTTIMGMCRVTPGGRLLLAEAKAPKCGVALEVQPEMVVAQLEQQHEWGPREDWQTAIKRGETKLPFEKWKEQKK